MPNIAGKIFPYTAKGVKAAGKAIKKLNLSKPGTSEADAEYKRVKMRKKVPTSDGYMMK